MEICEHQQSGYTIQSDINDQMHNIINEISGFIGTLNDITKLFIDREIKDKL